MKKLKQINWTELDTRVATYTVADAAKEIFRVVIEKINELVEAYNESIKS